MTVSRQRFEREQICDELQQISDIEKAFIKEAIVKYRRLDILSEVLMGLSLKPFHKSMQKFILRNQKSLQLVFRGGGKTTTCTVVKAIWHVLVNPDVRILIASKTAEFAKDVLKEIRTHLESNELLLSIFGIQKGEKWGQNAIEVLGRTKPQKEPTITTVGANGQIVGKHYDVIFIDDLVDENNSQTQYMRDQVRTFYYKTLFPTLEPDGLIHIVGTRYHNADLYGVLIENEFKEHHQIIRALDDKERSPWPEKFSSKFFIELRKNVGKIIFDSQYQCDTEAMKGEIFQYEWLLDCSPEDVPDNAQIYIGVDLAISQKESADLFAISVIGVLGKQIWVFETYGGHLTFGKQVDMLIKYYDEYDPISLAIETNAYQDALAQHLKETRPDIRITKIQTKVDKRTRAWKLAQRTENGEVFFVKGRNRMLKEHLVMFPSHRYKDLFDALDIAIAAAFRKRKRKRRERRKIRLF